MNTMNYPARVPHAESALLPDGFLAVYHQQKKLSYIIPPLGGVVWELCDGKRSVNQIVEEVTSLAWEHGTPPPNIAEDVNNLLDQLAKDGLLNAQKK